MMRFKLLIPALLICALGSSAQSVERPVLSAWGLEAGSAHMADTYLTPLHYSGWHLGIDYERMQAMRFSPERWIMGLDIRLGADRTLNPAKNAAMWSADLDGRWTMLRRWRGAFNVDGLTLGVGPSTDLRLGVLYLKRNGNNPAAAKGAFTVNASVIAAYNWRIGRLPVTFRYLGTMAMTGIFFAPQYGELYYEIWLGDRSGLVRGAWPGNYVHIDNQLTADLRLGGTTLRLGYRGDIISTKASGVVSRRIVHSFTLAVVTEWLSLNPHKRMDPDARIISALY